MNTLFFKYVIEVEQTRSITKAADNLFMAQPNLSKAIKEVEDTMGFPIFERTSKGVIPTSKGKEFLKYAHNIISQLEKMESIGSSDSKEQQSFRISIPRGSYIAHAFTSFVAELDKSKSINISVQETNSMQTISNIVDGPFQLGIIRYQTIYEQYFMDFLHEKHLQSEPIWEFEYVVVMSENHPLAGKKTIDFDYLKEYTEIVHGDTYIPYLSGNGKALTGSSQVKKKIYLYERCNQFELLCKIPTTFMWVSPIPEDLLRRYQLVQRKCSIVGNHHKDVLVYPNNYKFTTLDRKFVDKLSEAKNEVAFNHYE